MAPCGFNPIGPIIPLGPIVPVTPLGPTGPKAPSWPITPFKLALPEEVPTTKLSVKALYNIWPASKVGTVPEECIGIIKSTPGSNDWFYQ